MAVLPARSWPSSGVVPQQIAGGEIYPSLEKGTIDAAEWVAPTTTRNSASTRWRRSIIIRLVGRWLDDPQLHQYREMERFAGQLQVDHALGRSVTTRR